MAVSVNLIPEQHQAKLRDERNRTLAVGLAAAICGAIVALVVLLFVWTQAQNLALGRLQKDIGQKQQEIQATPDLQAVLTLQSNLDSVPGLYRQRRHVSRFFEILQSVSPTDFAVSSVSIENNSLLSVSAQARSYRLAAKLAQAMEASNVNLGDGAQSGNQPHFSNVVLSAVSAQGDDSVSFSLTANIAPEVTSGN